MNATSESEAQVAACRYILLMLLQRLDSQHAGLIEEIIAGVSADRASIESNGQINEAINRVFKETQKLLAQAKAK